MGLVGSSRAGPKMEVFAMRNAVVLIAILATYTILSGCAAMKGPGVYNGLSDDPWYMFTVGRGDGKSLTLEQCKLLDTIANEEWEQVKLQLSPVSEAAASNALPYGLVGAGGGGIIDKVTSISAGLIGFGGGAFSGAQVWSYSAVWQIWERIYNRLDYLKGQQEPAVAGGLYVSAGFVRTTNAVCGPLLKSAAAS